MCMFVFYFFGVVGEMGWWCVFGGLERFWDFILGFWVGFFIFIVLWWFLDEFLICVCVRFFGLCFKMGWVGS